MHMYIVLVIYNDSTVLINCFDNDMLIPYGYPLIKIFNSN